MKKGLVVLTLLFPAWNARAEVICALGQGVSSYRAASDQRPSNDSMQLAGRVNAAMKAICSDHCPSMPLFRNPTAANMMLVAASGDAKLVYSPQFLGAVYNGFGDDGVVALIAHELGHALDSSFGAPWINNAWTPEVRADAWAGCILAKFNFAAGGLHQALAALAQFPPPSQTAWKIRVPAVRTGYTHCGGVVSKFDGNK
jgi:hypothetical protein